MKKCKSCFTVNHAQEIEKALEQLRQMRHLKLCEQEEYTRRLHICETCAQVDENGVCMACGCYVQIRALIQSNQCPLGRQKKW